MNLPRTVALWLALAVCPALPARAASPSVHLAPLHAGDVAPHVQLVTPHPTLWRLDPARPTFPTDVHELHHGGTPEQAFDLVLVGDGFLASERTDFLAAAQASADAFLSVSPYGAYAALFNIYALFVASPEAGASHPSANVWVNNAFGTTFDYGGIARLAVADNDRVLAAVHAALPVADVAVVLVNDTQYGGSGGPVPVVSVAPESIAILRHELAHNLAGLADEYTEPYPGYPSGDAEPNVAAKKHLAPLKWGAWVAPETPIPTSLADATSDFAPVGAYEGARYKTTGMYRPAPHCMMRELASGFCPICAEALIVSLHARTQFLRDPLPLAGDVTCVVGACPQFSAQAAGIQHVRWTWFAGDTEVAQTPTWTPGPGDEGAYTLTVLATDVTPAVRSDPDAHLTELASWRVDVRPATDDATGSDGVQLGEDATNVGAVPASVPPSSQGCRSTGAAQPGASLCLWLAAAIVVVRRRGAGGAVTASSAAS